MEPTVQIALIGMGGLLITGVASPVVLHFLQARMRTLERDADKKERDEVKKQAEEAADLLLKKQLELAARAEEAARLLVQSNADIEAKAAASSKATLEKLSAIKDVADTVHVLVNSNMTASVQGEYNAVVREHDAIAREIVMMLEVIDLKKAAGVEPNREALIAVEATRAKLPELRTKIDELKISLTDRLKAADVVLNSTGAPIPVTDRRATEAAERTATALERTAASQERAVDEGTNRLTPA